jgi:hypothetical protein
MPRNYQRDDRDWRRQQPYPEESRWSNSRSDDDFSMGLGQEGRESRSQDYGRRTQDAGDRPTGREGMRRPGQFTNYSQMEEGGRGQRFGSSYRGRENDYYSPEDYRGGDMDWDDGNEGFQNSSRWQRSQFRPYESDYGYLQQASRPEQNTASRSWSEPYDAYGSAQRGWYEGSQDAMRRSEGQFVGRGPRNYKRSDDRIEEDINERLTRHGMVDATEIEVNVQSGDVTLRGTVDSRQAKRIAEDIVDAVSGVKEVSNQLKVKQRSEAGGRSDKGDSEQTGKQQRKAS